uniref:Cation-transporting ATPase n=1 Tax=Photinus pyralis TaxID=7054 RepID=A0A1Y1K832_PHOPY
MSNQPRRGYFHFSFQRNKNCDQNNSEQQAGLLKGLSINAPDNTMFINKGKDDQMEICGYKPSKLRLAVTYLFIVLTCGLLRLLFHWIPHLYLRATCVPCPVNEAEQLLITELYNGKHKIYHVKQLRVLTPESVRKLKSDDNRLNHHNHYVPQLENSLLSVHFGEGIFRELDRLLIFTCKKVTYIWNREVSEFVKLRGLDQHVLSETLHRSKGLSIGEQFMRRLVYGSNEITVKELPVVTLLFLEVLNPFYIFQLFSFCLWFADSYYYYAAAIMIMSVFGITMTVIQTRRNQRNLKSTVHSSDVISVVRSKPKSALDDHAENDEVVTEVISTELLVPGDVIEIPPHGCILHCDAVLLTGNCILNESMLTGESVPVTKTPLPDLPNLYYNSKEHARHTLFCGTQVIQTRYFGNEKVLAVVIRTGFCTAKGGLVRSILYPPPVDFRFENDSYRFIMLLAAIAGVGFVYTIVTKILRGIPAADLVLEALDLITIVVPPALPAAMTVGRLYAQTRLRKNQIFCISPRTINVSGSIDCICFDKTGTLTEDGLDLLCIVPVDKQNFLPSVKNVESLPYNTFVCGLVSCHSLTIIDKQVTGDPLDLKMFESTKWSIEEHDVSDNTKFNMIFPTVLKPPKNRPPENRIIEDIDLQIGIIREFPFSSSSQRMGVIVRKLGAQNFEYYCKGSPEMIVTFVRKETIPSDFYDVLETYTQEGYRVIAMAHKELKMSYAKVQRAQRDVIETDLTLLGLIVLENRLKPQTIPCIRNLNDANIRVIMVTGDNILTALSVARDCDIVTPGQSVITINCDNSTPPQLSYTLSNTKRKTSLPVDYSLLSNSASIQSLDTLESQTVTNNMSRTEVNKFKPKSLYNNYRFTMSGKVWGVIRDYYPELIPRLVTRGSIFARMSPDQKQQLIEELQSMGYCVAMCGDGANDCGALKAAHVGISLSEAESSVASPFTSKNANITAVLDIIKEGRAALVTSFGIFKYMASYSLCQFISVMILYSIDSNLTDMQYLYIDLFIISIFAFFFGRTEAYSGKLVKETPLSSLISVSPVLSLLIHLSLTVAFQVASFEHLKTQEWFVPFNSSLKDEKDSVACVENYTIYTLSSFQYIILAIVFSKGKPYRQSVCSNYGLIVSAIALTAFSIYMALWPATYLTSWFELIVPEDFTFRMYLILYAGLNFVISIFVEIFVIDFVFFKKLRFKFHDVYKSKRKYLATERDLQADAKWPVLTSEFKSAASPLTPVTHCTAEIVVEKENKFDKNHVLNCLYNKNSKVGVHNINLELLKKSNESSPAHSASNDSESDFYHSFDSNSPTTPERINLNLCPAELQFRPTVANGKGHVANLEMNSFENS